MTSNDPNQPRRNSQQGSSSSSSRTGFHFVVLEHPGDANEEETRRNIRSHVTRLQHHRTRQGLGGQGSSRSQSSRETTPTDAPRGSRNVAIASRADVFEVSTTVVRRLSFLLERSGVGSGEDRDARRSPVLEEVEAAARTGISRVNADAFARVGGALADAFSRGTLSFRTIALNDHDDVIGENIHGLALNMAAIMACYRSICQIQARDFEQQYTALGLTVTPGSSWQKFFALIFADPCLLTVAILLVVRYLLRTQGREMKGKVLMHMLSLEGHLVRIVNVALQETERATSDPLLVAVALCAAYEIRLGKVNAYAFHMSGLVRMLEIRGGLDAVDESTPGLARLLLWHDVNTSATFGCEPYLQRQENTRTLRPRANPSVFGTPLSQQHVQGVIRSSPRD